ncbi:hypothetical protein EMM73_11910 [Rheinheimera sediminis]|uniref:hypothetical protein n=1 Tax=Rheinheimera sp. YQF-1 TaxID=2499626 RepID=UPI000FD847B4|nr:hypothetical protein [Rheinheimera sp. YQF-1]RVT45667.1 hypothetical protein EMM73_11910 [Rheinheimera sp. YQF-1]
MANNSKIARKRLKESGQLEHFKKAVSESSKDRIVLTSEDGGVYLFDKRGQRFTDNVQLIYASVPVQSDPLPLAEKVKLTLNGIISLFRRKGIKLRDPLSGISYSGKQIRENNKFELGSHLDLCSLYLVQADILLNKETKVEVQLSAAYELGDISRCLKVSHAYGQNQRKIAKVERKRGLSEIFENLKAMKNAGSKPKELWPEFIAMLGNEEQYFDNVQEVAPNPQNCKTWSVSFVIIPNKDGAKHKDEQITYGRFVRRLNEK